MSKAHLVHLLVFLSACIMLGVCIVLYQDYGASWDEPLFYTYATSIRKAYSLEDHLEGRFRLDDAFSSTPYDHRFYGPAYLLLAGTLVEELKGVLPGSIFDSWHLVNASTFLLGGVCLFYLARRWLSVEASFGAMLLYLLQPVIWGHAFINPKDVPFATSFIAAVLAGYKMVDLIHVHDPIDTRVVRGYGLLGPERRRLGPATLPGLTIIILALILGKQQLLSLVGFVVRIGYTSPESILGRWLSILSPHVRDLPVEAYLHKAWVLAMRGWLLLLLGSVALLILLGWACIPTQHRRLAAWVVGAGTALGIATSVRVLGPFSGLLVMLYASFRPAKRYALVLTGYLCVAASVAYATWPYLWSAPISNFLNVLQHMAAVPETLNVLYAGMVTSSESLPPSYMPQSLLLTLTEPTILLAGLGAVGMVRTRPRPPPQASGLLPLVLWFVIPVGYVVATSAPMYDGYRHYLFILPPLFLLAGFGLDWLFEYLGAAWKGIFILVLSLAPGAIGIGILHPYEYTYFNTVSGGLAAASRHYETDYWLTCYREAMTSPILEDYRTLLVHRQPSLAALYARPGATVSAYDPMSPPKLPLPNTALLLTTRANSDLVIQPTATVILQVGRSGAPFCIVKALD